MQPLLSRQLYQNMEPADYEEKDNDNCQFCRWGATLFGKKKLVFDGTTMLPDDDSFEEVLKPHDSSSRSTDDDSTEDGITTLSEEKQEELLSTGKKLVVDCCIKSVQMDIPGLSKKKSVKMMQKWRGKMDNELEETIAAGSHVDETAIQELVEKRFEKVQAQMHAKGSKKSMRL